MVAAVSVLEHKGVGTLQRTHQCWNTAVQVHGSGVVTQMKDRGATITSLVFVLCCEVTKRETQSAWLQDRHFCLQSILTLRDQRSG